MFVSNDIFHFESFFTTYISYVLINSKRFITARIRLENCNDKNILFIIIFIRYIHKHLYIKLGFFSKVQLIPNEIVSNIFKGFAYDSHPYKSE